MDSDYEDEELISAPEDLGEFEDKGVLQLRPQKEALQKSLVAAQIDDMKDVAETLNIKMHHARTLLIYHRWNKDRLCDNFAEKGAEQLFAEAGVAYQAACAQLEPLNMDEKILCGVCFDDVEQQYSTRMDCGHCFCNECWTEYFISSIGDGQSRRLKCMTPKCGVICDEDKVLSLLGAKDPLSQRRYHSFLLQSYIEDNAKVKWCPCVPPCGYAVQIKGDPFCEIQCVCGNRFCYNCLCEAHSPCSCMMWQLWTKRFSMESANVTWITVNTKSCPQCSSPVEKNGGCNLVYCRCGQCFCWLCGGATGRVHTYSNIEGHSCGRYKPEKAAEVSRTRIELKRYIHYHNRYSSHTDSIKREEKQRENVLENINIRIAAQNAIVDYSWLADAVEDLLKARKALLHSYVFAYYMFGGELFKEDISLQQNKQNQDLFEVQQQMFERYVEALSREIENFRWFDDERQISDARLTVIGLATIVTQRCEKMYDIVNDLLSSVISSSHHNISPYKCGGQEEVTLIAIPIDSMDRTLDEKQAETDSSILVEQSHAREMKDGVFATESRKPLEMQLQNQPAYNAANESRKRPFEDSRNAANI